MLKLKEKLEAMTMNCETTASSPYRPKHKKNSYSFTHGVDSMPRLSDTSQEIKRNLISNGLRRRRSSIGTPSSSSNKQTNPMYKPQFLRISPRASMTLHFNTPILRPNIQPLIFTKGLSKRKTKFPTVKRTASVKEEETHNFEEFIKNESSDKVHYKLGEKILRLNSIANAINYI